LGLSPEQRARRPAALDRGGSRIRGASEAIQHLHRQIERAGRLNQPVLILAEPGFDTRLIVRWLAKSGGRTGRRISQRLRGLPDDQATSLMFGHQFDGGPLRRGRIREAEGGTIHVPDLFELSPTLQARFVRALKEAAAGRVRVESVNTYDQGEMVDVRFIADAATDPRGSSPRDLPTIVHELYLHVAHVVLRWPPLRERVEDIAHIATSCLEDTAVGRRLSPRALERLEQHPWWGNERELEMVLTRCLVRTPEGETIPVRMVDEVLRELGPTLTTTGLPIPCDLESDLAKIELATLEAARRQSGGNASKAGELVGLKSPKNFGRKLEAARKTANVGVQA
ncbi:MAG: sigma 54-interacting transcriptional regulator, partial [Myxococcales bacterium]|nr:sigma 54-interacting transcriptional regulator [Myxococcales bacterium]